MSADDLAAELEQLYGLRFPRELFEVWQLAQRLRQEQPWLAFNEFDISLTGPFDVLAGDLNDREPPALPMVMHYRYYMDQPEFFTVATGGVDGLHWGYWFDIPGERPPIVCHYYNNDAYEIAQDGPSLLRAIAHEIARSVESAREYKEDEPDEAEYYDGKIAEGTRLINAINDFIAERGLVFETARRLSVAPTFGGMGVLLPEGQVGVENPYDIETRAHEGEGKALLEEAKQPLVEGQPGQALQIAKAVWCMYGSREHHPQAAEVCADAYDQLDRPALAEISRAQAKHRSIPNVDLLEP